MKRKALYKINVLLLALLFPALVSSILQEFLRGTDLAFISNNMLTVLHLIVCLPMFLFIGIHLFANCGKIGQWFAKIKHQKPSTQWLFWLSLVTLFTGIAATITYFRIGHTGIGGIHGKIGFITIAIMIWHTIKRIKWYKFGLKKSQNKNDL
jgi:hypothetical protein